MARCQVCGNDYAKPMEIHLAGKIGIFDSFECAIHAMAPVCTAIVESSDTAWNRRDRSSVAGTVPMKPVP